MAIYQVTESNPVLEILSLLACPDCKSGLVECGHNSLFCDVCKREYVIKSGIPILYPRNLDISHLQEEVQLAGMMKGVRKSQKEKFSAEQWAKSKDEFWQMVRTYTPPPQKTMVNIGCGYDTHYIVLEEHGHTMLNFDIVFDMLLQLSTISRKKYCVAGDINSLPFANGSFDAIVTIDIIHHECENIFELLKVFNELLKPGGILFLEDVNAWGIFQFPKSILLPKSIHRFLRSTYHKLRHSEHKPADYEFPTNPWSVIRMLKKLGFSDIQLFPNISYPNIGKSKYQLYKLLSASDWIKKYHNFHYMLKAVKQI